MITVTPAAIKKIKEIMAETNPLPAGFRVGIQGGGCSGFNYHMEFENEKSDKDQVYEIDGLQMFVDQASEIYLDGTEIDYVEKLDGSGFKFHNPNVKSTCGCGESFSV